MTIKKTVLFGGTFDPIHLGHIAVASEASELVGAEKIVFIPAKRSPLKKIAPIANDNDRLTMTALAIADNERFQLSDYELNKPEPSYTLETVRKFQADYGSDTLIYWLTGADNIKEMPRWYRITDLIDECNLTLMYRAGCQAPDFKAFENLWGLERVEKLQQNIIQTPLIDISSTKIRNRLAASLNADDMLCQAVADYIRKHNLYHPNPQS